MKLTASDPDIETIVSRIRREEIDLQPDFQRGEVWSDNKKIRLIDSILRNWHVPPVHLIQRVDGGVSEEVLDGQQRLAAIRDFASDKLRVDGRLQPVSPEIQSLHGLTFSKLPPDYQRRFNRFTIRVIAVSDFTPAEAGELFFRLNQPTNLTTAEHRNALFGPTRQQVRSLVKKFESVGLTREFVGFSNSRMAYDDILARFCKLLEAGTLHEKLSSVTLAERYRSDAPFSDAVIFRATSAIDVMGEALRHGEGVRLNKATLLSWLVFSATLTTHAPELTAKTGKYLRFFEACRSQPSRVRSEYFRSFERAISPELLDRLFNLFNDRASARVADVTSVITRDAVLWLVFLHYRSNAEALKDVDFFAPLVRLLSGLTEAVLPDTIEELVDASIARGDWGRLR